MKGEHQQKICPVCQSNPIKAKISGQDPVTCGDECSTLRSRLKTDERARAKWREIHAADLAYQRFCGVPR